MKEKNKKILKGFGVGALACLGMFGLTGCANVDISQKKVDSLIERFEEFSEKTTREEILNLYHTAYYNAMFQTNGYENVSIEITGKVVDVPTSIMIYKNSETTMLYGEDMGANAFAYYDNESNNVVNAGFYLTNQGYVCIYKDVEDSFDAPIEFGRIVADLLVGGGVFGDENLVAYKVLENGNYSLRFETVDEDVITYGETDKEGEYRATYYYTFEITKDAKVVSMKAKTNIDLNFECDQETWEAEVEDYIIDCEATYSYGTADIELMQELYELAQAAPEDGEEE